MTVSILQEDYNTDNRKKNYAGERFLRDLDMAPEDEVINPSSLTKFRKLRLKDMNLLDMLIAKTVQLALEKGIIKSKSIIVDATHTKSRYNQKTPRQVLQEQSKKTAP